MFDYKYAELFQKNSVDKQLKIKTDDGLLTITNTDIPSEQFELTESICSESELQFGSCEASEIKFRIYNAFNSLKDKWLAVTSTLNGNTDDPFQFGRYKVHSDKPTADRKYRDVTAYDAMYDIINSDVADWYNTILPNSDSTVTLKQFRDSFIKYFGLDQEQADLVNDGMIIHKTIEPSELSGKDVITAICEINGCFGNIGRNGKFRYVFLPKYSQGLYPANDLFPADDLFPRQSSATKINSSLYISCKYEDYLCERINKVQIRQKENDIGAIYPNSEPKETDNTYIVQGNFLVYGKSASELNEIAKNLLSVITDTEYRPFSAEVLGNPCFEVGDCVRFTTRYKIVESYILNRTLKGVQALRDTYSADGEQYYTEKLNSANNSIVELRGKTNELTRNVEETRSELKDTEQSLRSTISQTAGEIRAEVQKADEGLSSRITQNANSITAEVSRASTAEGNLSSRITVNENAITQRVTKGSVSSEISQEAGKINISSNRLAISSTNFTLTEDGTVTAKSGVFDNVTINSSCTVAGQSITGPIGGGASWNGSAIQNAYIGGLDGSKLVSGNVGIGYSYGNTYIDSLGINSSGSSNFFDSIQMKGSILTTYGGSSGSSSTIGTQTAPFNSVWASTLHGAVVSNTSSIETKEDIEKQSIEGCLQSVLNTEVVSYKYKKEFVDKKAIAKRLKNQKTDYIASVKKRRKKGEEPNQEQYESTIQAFDSEIEELEKPEDNTTKYGFISEYAPEEIVTSDGKGVNLYSCIAMAYGAIQKQQEEIEALKATVSFLVQEVERLGIQHE